MKTKNGVAVDDLYQSDYDLDMQREIDKLRAERDAYRALLLEWERCAYAPREFAARVRATLEGPPARL